MIGSLRRTVRLWNSGARDPRKRPHVGLALAGGGVIGGMYEVGALTALEKRLNSPAFDLYVGCSAGSVVASLLAGGIRASDIYRILDNDLDDPLNFRRNAVFAADSFRQAWARFGRMVWAFGKNAMIGPRGSVPDMLAPGGARPADRLLLAGGARGVPACRLRVAGSRKLIRRAALAPADPGDRTRLRRARRLRQGQPR